MILKMRVIASELDDKERLALGGIALEYFVDGSSNGAIMKKSKRSS